MIRISQIRIGIDVKDIDAAIRKSICRKLRIRSFDRYRIIKESIDARHKPEIFRVFTVCVDLPDEKNVLLKSGCKTADIYEEKPYIWPEGAAGTHRPVIIGMGPAGLFCGYMLAKAGCKPILCDRGKRVEDRRIDVEQFWKDGVLKPESNVQFGEGGAGTFSDGKLNTLVNDKHGRNLEVLRIFVENGAPEDILYRNKPHIGTDILSDVVASMRDKIIALGGEFRYGHKLVSIENNGELTDAIFEDNSRLTTDALVLAIGHSARDTYKSLYDIGVPMEAKSFAVGLRVIHPQRMIDEAMYGDADLSNILGAASYKLTYNTGSGRGVYSFCMCPGGYVVNASSEEGRLAVNGMSYSGRAGRYANSGIIVTVTPDDYESDGPLAGIDFQRKLEAENYRLGQGKIPIQSYPAYTEGRVDEVKVDIDAFKGETNMTDMSHLLPPELRDAFIEGMESFNKTIDGFASDAAILAGIESRTSSPVRIHRDDEGRSAFGNVYPCGEGAGYAGGITSAAMDGIYIAEEIWKKNLIR